jgi:hypothetical protein
MKPIVMSLLALTLAACQSAGFRFSEDSPHYPPPVGTRVILHQPVTIPTGHASTYLQFGRTMRFAEVDQYRAHCRLEVSRVGTSEQTVMPDEFRVTRAGLEHRDSVRRGETTRLASAGMPGMLAQSGRHSGSMGIIVYVTRMKLHSDRQPEVLSLDCGHWSANPDEQFLTLNQIRAALGTIMSLQLPVAGG